MDAGAGVDLLPEGAVRRMVTAANNHELEAMVAEFCENYENITPIHPAQNFTGRAQVRRNWERLFAGIPDLRLVVHGAATGPDGRVWMEWSNHGTRHDGTAVEMAGVCIFGLRDDRIASVHFYLEPVDHGPRGVDLAVQEAVRSAGRPASPVGGGRP